MGIDISTCSVTVKVLNFLTSKILTVISQKMEQSVLIVAGAWIGQWLAHSLATTVIQDRIPVSACGRVVVARPRSVVFPRFSGFLHHVWPQNAPTSAPLRMRKFFELSV